MAREEPVFTVAVQAGKAACGKEGGGGGGVEAQR